MLRVGIYRHFRNNREYRVLYVAKNEADREPVVVYEALYGDHEIWVRPLKIFTEIVEHEGTRVPRFEFIREY